MTTYNQFISAILAEPEDDQPRLILADWLEEQGFTQRAELIRVQCKIAEKAFAADHDPTNCLYTPCKVCEELEYLTDLLKREKKLLDMARRADWSNFRRKKFPDCVEVYRRGFLDEVRCTSKDWYENKYGPKAIKLHPTINYFVPVDKSPFCFYPPPRLPGEDPLYCQWRRINPDRYDRDYDDSYYIHDEVFDLMPHGYDGTYGVKRYQNVQEAVFAVSQGYVFWARRLV